jgi:folate-binding protein YgfZ
MSAPPGVVIGSHALVWVTGPDAISFLDGQVSQDVVAMATGTVQRSLLLEPRGKLRAILSLLRDAERVGLLVQSDGADAVVAALEQFRFRVKAEITVDPRPGHSVWGTPGGPPRWHESDDVLTVVTPDGWSLVIAIAPPPGRILSADEFAAHRIAAAEPWFGVDVDDGTIPQETGLVAAAVSFTKGCYLGQELVARIDSRGHVNRHLRRLSGTGEIPPVGAEVRRGDTVVGTTGTTAPGGSGWLSLAVLRREAEPGVEVTVHWPAGESKATVAPSHSPNAAAP